MSAQCLIKPKSKHSYMLYSHFATFLTISFILFLKRQYIYSIRKKSRWRYFKQRRYSGVDERYRLPFIAQRTKHQLLKYLYIQTIKRP